MKSSHIEVLAIEKVHLPMHPIELFVLTLLRTTALLVLIIRVLVLITRVLVLVIGDSILVIQILVRKTILVVQILETSLVKLVCR